MRSLLSPYTQTQRRRANWTQLVPQVTFVLFLCRATRNRVGIEGIAEQAVAAYPKSFYTVVDRKKIPDLSLIALTLGQAKRKDWGFVAGDWFRGCRLTRKGLQFARDVKRCVEGRRKT